MTLTNLLAIQRLQTFNASAQGVQRLLAPSIRSMGMPMLLLLLLWCPLKVSAAGFDCTKATSRVEILICGDDELSRLDDKLAAEYGVAQRVSIQNSLVRAQRAWVAHRNSCDSKDCVRLLYESRISELVAIATRFPSSAKDKSNLPEYVVKCDTRESVLSIYESGEATSRRKPVLDSGVVSYSIHPQVLTKTGGTDSETLRLHAGSRRFECRLSGVLYIVKITPYIFNARVMGQCGAENPVIAAEVERNGKIILKEQRFASCIPDRRTIHRITFHERIESMQIAATLDEHFLPIRIERAFAYAGLPGYFEEAVFDTFPSGAAEADLFVAVQRGNINEVRQALEMGASPNARDERGFTPVAYLRKSGKEGLAQGRTQEELERDLDEIARLLFARGASGNVRSNNGHSLLEYLIHDASSTVIDLLLRNGADPKSDGSLRHAVVYGESELVGRLLVLGSDPNRKERDGLTALWFASRSGFDDFIDRPTPPIQDYIRCVRSLLMHGARVDAAVRDSEGLLWFMVRDYWQDERVKLILAELIPYSSKSAIASSYNLSVKIGTSKGSPSLSNWLGQFVRP